MLKKIVKYFSGAKLPEKRLPTQDNEIFSERKCYDLQGDLSVVTIENLMQLMSHAGLSGELRLFASQNSACFIIDEGTLVFGYLKSNSFRIGERLLQKKFITMENLNECLQTYKDQSAKPKFGTLLIEKGFLSNSDLEETIKEQVRDIFFEVLSWKEGTFAFCASECTSNEDVRLEERIDHLIITGIIQMENKV